MVVSSADGSSDRIFLQVGEIFISTAYRSFSTADGRVFAEETISVAEAGFQPQVLFHRKQNRVMHEVRIHAYKAGDVVFVSLNNSMKHCLPISTSPLYVEAYTASGLNAKLKIVHW